MVGVLGQAGQVVDAGPWRGCWAPAACEGAYECVQHSACHGCTGGAACAAGGVVQAGCAV